MELLQAGDSPFEKVFYDLLSDPAPPVVNQVGANFVSFLYPGGQRAVVFRWVADAQAAIAEELRAVMKTAPKEVALIGGPPEGKHLLEKAVPTFTFAPIFVYHLPDGGPLWRSKSPVLKPPLARRLLTGLVGAPDEEAWRALVRRTVESHTEIQKEASEFTDVIRSRTPVGTYALIAVIGAMFLVEMALGGAESMPVLARLGALVPSLVPKEPWRLFSSAFLHIGVFHVLINCYVLFIIGSFLERVIGTWRFLVVFFLSVLGGSIVSMIASPAVLTAGASGGVLGLIGAQSVLAFRPHGLLPTVLIPGARRAAVINFALNVFNSFRPGVSLSAHLGGGLVGAGLLFSSFFVRGLPRLDKTGEGDGARVDPAWVRGLALTGVVVMLGSIAAAVALGGALRLGSGETKRVPVGKSSATVSLPADLQPCTSEEKPAEGGTLTTMHCGDMLRDPVLYIVVALDFAAPAAPESLEEGLAKVKADIAQPEALFPELASAEDKFMNGHKILLARFPQAKGGQLVKEVAAFLTVQREVAVTTVYWKDRAGSAGSAERALASVDTP